MIQSPFRRERYASFDNKVRLLERMPGMRKLKADDWLLFAVVSLTLISAVVVLVKSLRSGDPLFPPSRTSSP